MTISKSAYNTTVTKGYILPKIENALELAYYHGATESIRENVHMVRDGLGGGVNGIPAFNFPIISKLKDADVVFFDARSVISVDNAGNTRVRDEVELQARIIQAQLALDWHHGQQARIRDMSPMGLQVYAHWLGEVIAKRFALDAREQLQISVLAAIFYLNCFWDETDATTQEIGYLQSAITRICGYRHSDVADIIEAHPIIRDMGEFCEAVKSFTQSVRLEDFNSATLAGAVQGSWFGNMRGEIMAIALEYPPVWLTLLFQSITNRGFKKAGLTQIVERNTYKKHHEGFVRSMAHLSQPDAS